MSKEDYLLKQQQKEKEQIQELRRKKTRNFFWLLFLALIIFGGISGFVFLLKNQPASSGTKIIVRQGLHWHSELSIKILGETQEIPANIGIGATHLPLHTHQPDGVLHMEFSGLVREDDLKLGNFFEIWKKRFNRDCIFDKCSGQEGKLKMFVNGKESFEFENYIMRDGDKIEIIFE